MRLVSEVTTKLEKEGIDFALIGAAALAAHGVIRSTADIDFLTVDSKVLQRELWADLEKVGHLFRLMTGDFDDPLAGSVRFTDESAQIVDVIVGRHPWQEDVIERGVRVSIGEVEVRVVRPADLVLLKLFAGGPQDAWDIHALLNAVEEKAAILAEIESTVTVLPRDCGALWARIRDEV